MAETVKTFSPELQIEVKSKIFVIVNDAERKNINFSNITSINSQKATFSDQPFPSTQIHQQHWVTTPQAQFHQQQQQHQLSYPPAIPHTYSQPQPQPFLSYQPYSHQHSTELTPILSPSTDVPENIGNNNNDNE